MDASLTPSTAAQSPPGRAKRRGAVRDRVVELARVRAGDLVANPGNWRRHPERQRAALRGLLRGIGYADALLARREGEQLVLIDGHLRQSLDPEQVVPVLVLDVSAKEADTLLATLDPLAGMATADPGALVSLLERVRTSDQAVRDLLERVAREAGVARAPLLRDLEEVPALPETPRTRPGDLWVLGPHRLLCGDARDPAALARIMAGERADVLWTDPPYGVSYVGRTERALWIEGQVVFLQAFSEQGWRLHQTLVWVKDAMVLGHADYHYRHEPIAYGYAGGAGRWGRGAKGWYGGNGEDSVIEVGRPRASPEHPTAKPVELIRRCLHNSSRRGDLVLDPFAGSGSTLVASELLGRRGLGVEIDPRYCDVAVARLEALTGEGARREPG